MEQPLQIGDWKRISILGSGSFGEVTLWQNENIKDYVAVKRCKFQQSSSLSLRQKERWFSEVKIMKSLNHSNIVKSTELPIEFAEALNKYNPSKLPLLPMEYCRKGNLRYILREPKNICGLQEEDIRYILEDISNGLQYLHSLNITHRDIKPENIVLQHCDNRTNYTIYKIIDLGYAKELGDSTVSFVGTLYYLAPEIFANEKYNYSVDYWSMGVLTSEIISGELPFISSMSPFERYHRLKDKGPEDIRIYQAYSGNISTSSQLKKELHVSNCLKQNMEVWLRRVLQFDPKKRIEPFENNIPPLQYLHKILSKRIINVFSVFNLEFYSYEIDDGTMKSTLEDWISTDIKIPKNELILLFNNSHKNSQENGLLSEFLDSSNDVYAFKKGILVDKTISFNFPKLVKDLFKPECHLSGHLLKHLFAQTLYYIMYEKKVLDFARKSFNLHYTYVKYVCDNTIKECANMKKHLTKLLAKIECYSNLRKIIEYDFDLSDNYEYKDCIMYFQRLLSSVDRCIISVNRLLRRTTGLQKKKNKLTRCYAEVKLAVENCDIHAVQNKALSLLEKNDAKKEITSEIRKVISETIKMKDKLFRCSLLPQWSEASGGILCTANTLFSSLECFKNHIFELSSAFDTCELKHWKLLLNSAKQKPKVQRNGIICKERLNLSANQLIKDNQELRYQLENILSVSILTHTNCARSIETFYHDSF